MSTDGISERALIVTRLKTLADGRVFKGIADAETHKRFGEGTVKPYFGVFFSSPYPVSAGATMTAGDADTPQQMTITVTCYAGDMDLAEMGASKARLKLRDWAPSATCNPIRTTSGYSGSNSDGKSKPTRFEEGVHFTLLFNMGPDA